MEIETLKEKKTKETGNEETETRCKINARQRKQIAKNNKQALVRNIKKYAITMNNN